jgi:glycosyltransferase involved in cell wall biosynthesis
MALEGRRVLFISYNGMLDPLGQSQVLPYLRELAKRGVRFSLLSFERAGARDARGREACKRLRRQLANENIEWHWLRYHQRPSLPATAYDVIAGIRYAKALVRRNRIEMVHARSHIPATIALILKRQFGVMMIFDIRGLMAEEYVDAEHWRKGSLSYRTTKAMESRAFAAADGVVTLTEKIWPLIRPWKGLNGRAVLHAVIPCCVDLDLFSFSSEERTKRRAELGLGDRFTIVYSGSIDGWYLTEKMVDFFAHVLRERPAAHFLWLVTGRHDRIKTLMTARGLEIGSYTIKSVGLRDVPSYLSASDAGLVFIKPCFSKLASSPTKNAEYLACGLPLVTNAGIGDSDELITREEVGALVSDFNVAEYTRAIARIEELRRNPDRTRLRSRQVAERLFDLRNVGAQRYASLYESVLVNET